MSKDPWTLCKSFSYDKKKIYAERIFSSLVFFNFSEPTNNSSDKKKAAAALECSREHKRPQNTIKI